MGRGHAKLRGRIIEKFGTLGAFADAYGCDYSTLSRMLSEGHNWKKSEIKKCSDLLDIPMDELILYFF